MATNQIIGINWGKEGFSIILSEKGSPVKFFYASFDSYEQSAQTPGIADEMKQVAVLQKALKDNGITTTNATLSLPSSDIIIRSFMIPVVKQSELNGVVSFEAKKYVPFSLADLKYTYDAVSVVEDGVKKMRVLFVGVRTDVYQNYTSVLIQAGLTLLSVEPASVSLIRAISSKSLVPQNKCIAAVQVTEEGKITIIDEGLPIFVRDFSLTSQSPVAGDRVDPEMIKAKFYNEIKMSLDFFKRQYDGHSVSEILVIAQPERRGLWSGIEKDFGIDFRSYDPTAIIDVSSSPDMGILSAYGSTLVGSNQDLDIFRLSDEDMAKPGISRRRKSADEKPLDRKKIIKPAVFAVVLVCATFFGFEYFIRQTKEQLNTKKAELAEFVDMPLFEIEEKIQEQHKVIKAYETIPVHSDVLFFLATIPQKMPEGVWLANIEYTATIGDQQKKGRAKRRSSDDDEEIGYVRQHEKHSLTLKGRIYKENANEQIQLANDFLSALRKDEKLASYFDSIQLENIVSINNSGIRVLNFDIVFGDL